MKGLAIGMMVVVAVVVLAEPGRAAVTCDQAVSCVTPCLSYLTSGNGSPPAECCTGVSNLKQIAQTVQDRRTACQCLKDAASQNPNIKEDVAAGLPNECHVQFNVPISRSVDCNNVQ